MWESLSTRTCVCVSYISCLSLCSVQGAGSSDLRCSSLTFCSLRVAVGFLSSFVCSVCVCETRLLRFFSIEDFFFLFGNEVNFISLVENKAAWVSFCSFSVNRNSCHMDSAGPELAVVRLPWALLSVSACPVLANSTLRYVCWNVSTKSFQHRTPEEGSQPLTVLLAGRVCEIWRESLAELGAETTDLLIPVWVVYFTPSDATTAALYLSALPVWTRRLCSVFRVS